MGEDAPATRSAAVWAPVSQQSSYVPRERSVTSRPLPVLRAVRQRRSTGSEPCETMMPGPLLPVTRTSSSSQRAALVTCTPIEVSRITVRSTRTALRSSSASDGLSVDARSQSSTEPWASPLASTPLPRASRTVQPRRVARPRSLITTPLVPKCSKVQDSSELSVDEVTTTPAPVRLETRHSRIASEPELRARTVVHEAPERSQPCIATCPCEASTAGCSSSWPCTTRSVSITASTRSEITMPLRGANRTVPRACSATMVTRVVTTRFSSYVPGRTLSTAPPRALARASPIVRASPVPSGQTVSTWRTQLTSSCRHLSVAATPSCRPRTRVPTPVRYAGRPAGVRAVRHNRAVGRIMGCRATGVPAAGCKRGDC